MLSLTNYDLVRSGCLTSSSVKKFALVLFSYFAWKNAIGLSLYFGAYLGHLRTIIRLKWQ